VVIADEELDLWRATCEAIEKQSRKGKTKWRLTPHDRQLAYMRFVLQKSLFTGRLTFALYADEHDYDNLTIQTIALAVEQADIQSDNVILVDGLPKQRWKDYARWIRQRGVAVAKVRGIRRDESDPLIRLADALCGFVRAAHEGRPDVKPLFDAALGQGVVKDLRA
jgi:hypothetical protein